MKSAVITGANGFIGSNVVKKLADNGVFVTAVSRKNNNIMKSDNVRFISLDMNDINKLVDLDVKADVFYHFAWGGVSGDERVNIDIQLQNISWTVDALKVCKKINCNRFIGAGSIMEKETILRTLTQGDKPDLGYIYGGAKLAAHTISKAVAHNIGAEHIWGVITNAYGPGEISSRFINTTIRKIINGEKLSFSSAVQNYDFVYINDMAEAFYRIGLCGKPFYEYLIGSSHAKPLKKFILEMAQELCPDKELFFGKIPSGSNLPLSEFDCSLIETDTGFKAKVDFKDGIKETMKWMMDVKNESKI
jgi:nucleoside-diphosphate-sugar epimerase